MEVGGKDVGIGEVRGRFPGGSIGVVHVAFPFDEVFDLLVSKPRVEDRRDFPLEVIKDFDWFRRVFVPRWQDSRSSRFEEGDVKD